MSKVPTPEDLFKRIKSLLNVIPKEIEAYHKFPKTSPELVKQLLIEFTTNPLIKSLLNAPELQKSNTSQPDHATELAHIKTSLQMLNKAVIGLQKANPAPSDKVKPPKGNAQPSNNSFPTYLAAARARPKNASIILDLAQTQSAHAFRPRPVEICQLINDALMSSPHQQVCITAVRWTAKGNLVVIGGHDIPLQHLQLAAPSISQAFANAYTTAVNPIPPPTRANVKWSKLLINGLPTGASDTRGAFTPEECHKSLAANNPMYTSLLITQKPSWVRPPTSYQAGTSSSLVVAFEDPDGENLKSLLAVRYLYALGTRATVKKWKQRTHSRKQTSKNNTPDESDKEDIVETPSRAHTPTPVRATHTAAPPQTPEDRLFYQLFGTPYHKDQDQLHKSQQRQQPHRQAKARK